MDTSTYDVDPTKSAIPRVPLAKRSTPRHIEWTHGLSAQETWLRRASSRRIIVVVVPPVDELDPVGPQQVFNSVNRVVGRNIYTIEVVTNADRMTVSPA